MRTRGRGFAIGAGGDDFAATCGELGDFLGPLVDEQDDEVHVGILGGDGLRRCAAGARSCRSAAGDDQALAMPDGVSRSMTRVVSRSWAVSRTMWRRGSMGEIVEVAAAELLGDFILDAIDFQQSRPRAAGRRLSGPGDEQSLAKAEAADHGARA